MEEQAQQVTKYISTTLKQIVSLEHMHSFHLKSVYHVMQLMETQAN